MKVEYFLVLKVSIHSRVEPFPGINDDEIPHHISVLELTIDPHLEFRGCVPLYLQNRYIIVIVHAVIVLILNEFNRREEAVVSKVQICEFHAPCCRYLYRFKHELSTFNGARHRCFSYREMSS